MEKPIDALVRMALAGGTFVSRPFAAEDRISDEDLDRKEPRFWATCNSFDVHCARTAGAPAPLHSSCGAPTTSATPSPPPGASAAPRAPPALRCPVVPLREVTAALRERVGKRLTEAFHSQDGEAAGKVKKK